MTMSTPRMRTAKPTEVHSELAVYVQTSIFASETWSMPSVGRGPRAVIQVINPPAAAAAPLTMVNNATGARTRVRGLRSPATRIARLPPRAPGSGAGPLAASRSRSGGSHHSPLGQGVDDRADDQQQEQGDHHERHLQDRAPVVPGTIEQEVLGQRVIVGQ